MSDYASEQSPRYETRSDRHEMRRVTQPCFGLFLFLVKTPPSTLFFLLHNNSTIDNLTLFPSHIARLPHHTLLSSFLITAH